MTRQRDNVRNFPGKRWLNLGLRTVHIAGIVLLGTALVSGTDAGLGAIVTFVSGLGMFAGPTRVSCAKWPALVFWSNLAWLP